MGIVPIELLSALLIFGFLVLLLLLGSGVLGGRRGRDGVVGRCGHYGGGV
jgi:hypothetical protein